MCMLFRLTSQGIACIYLEDVDWILDDWIYEPVPFCSAIVISYKLFSFQKAIEAINGYKFKKNVLSAKVHLPFNVALSRLI